MGRGVETATPAPVRRPATPCHDPAAKRPRRLPPVVTTGHRGAEEPAGAQDDAGREEEPNGAFAAELLHPSTRGAVAYFDLARAAYAPSEQLPSVRPGGFPEWECMSPGNGVSGRGALRCVGRVRRPGAADEEEIADEADMGKDDSDEDAADDEKEEIDEKEGPDDDDAEGDGGAGEEEDGR